MFDGFADEGESTEADALCEGERRIGGGGGREAGGATGVGRSRSVGLIHAGRFGKGGAVEVLARSGEDEGSGICVGTTGEAGEGEAASNEMRGREAELSEGAVRERLLGCRSAVGGGIAT